MAAGAAFGYAPPHSNVLRQAMARGDLMRKLLASYGRDEEFRAVAEQIIREEEKKNNRVLANSLRKTLEATPSGGSAAPKALAPLIPFPEAAADYVERLEPSRTKNDIILSPTNEQIISSLVKEFRRGDDIRRHGLPVRSKLLFCGPPGCGKTLCAEVFAVELGLPIFVVKLDRLISSYLGETAANVRKIFEFARRQPAVVFFDEFDALARARHASLSPDAPAVPTRVRSTVTGRVGWDTREKDALSLRTRRPFLRACVAPSRDALDGTPGEKATSNRPNGALANLPRENVRFLDRKACGSKRLTRDAILQPLKHL